MGLIGALREAALGRIAQATGTPAVAPPYHGPSEEALRAALTHAGLRDDGMEVLTLGRGGPPLERPSAVGWVYWGRLVHTARSKIRAAVEGQLLAQSGGGGEFQGEPEYLALGDAGAFETIREQFNTRAAGREDTGTLAARLTTGPLQQSPPPSPQFAESPTASPAAGIRVGLARSLLRVSLRVVRHPHTHTPTHPHTEGVLRFSFAPPKGQALEPPARSPPVAPR